MSGFIFGGNTPWTYEQLQKKRAVADALAVSNMGTPRNVGEGLAAIGKALAFRSLSRKADKRDAELKGEFDAKYAGAFSGGGGGFGVAQPSYAGPAPTMPLDPNTPHALGDDAMAALGKPAVRTGADPASIKAGLVARGLPEHVADGFVMNFQDESGMNPGINEAAPLVPGSRGGFGLYQLTGPRRVAYEQYAAQRGVPVDDVDAQLDFLMMELQGPEAKAAQSILSTKDAGQAGAAIVNEFLRPAEEHRASRTARYTGGGGYAGGMDIATLADLASNPYATDGQKAVMSALLQQNMQMLDPMYRMQMEREQLELAQMQSPDQGPAKAPDVETFYDENTGQQYKAQWDGQRWVPVGGTQAPADPLVSVDLGGDAPPNDEALRKKLGEKEGEAWASYMEAGTVSAGAMQDMQLLDELITLAPQGPIEGRLASAFPGISSAADAFTSVVKRVAPTLRAPGSGATSDIEYDGMLKSLPQLSAQPEANRAISAMMKAKAQINIERGQIIADYQNEEIGVAEARKRMGELNSRSIMTPELEAILKATAPAPQPGSDMSDDDAEFLRSIGVDP